MRKLILFVFAVLTAFAGCAKNAPIKPEGVSLDRLTLSLAVDGTATLKATVTPDNAANKDVKWESSAPAIATVDAGGKVTALKAGTATITVKTVEGGKTDFCTVTVEPQTVAVSYIVLSSTLELYEGDSQTLKATVAPDNATDKTLKWESSAPAIATVDAAGKVTAVKAGSAVITVTAVSNNKSTFCTVKVTPAREGILVAADGSGDFTRIQDAINSVPNNKTTRTVIFLKKGKYDAEKLIVPRGKNNITLMGEDREQTIVSYHIYDCSNHPESGNKCPAASVALWQHDERLMRTSATLTVEGDGFVAENLTIENTAGPVGQALAITVTGDRGIYRNCNLYGYQDTIYLWSGGKRTYFENCLVTGRTDYIYGGGIGFFESCEIRSWGGGWITAPSTAREQAYGFVFHKCRLTYASGSPRAGDDGQKFALGRPWHNYPKVAWLECWMTEMVNPLGWPTKWNMDNSDTSAELHLYEYKNTGPGADMSGRAKWAGLRALTDDEALNYTVVKVLGYDPTI